MPLGRRGGGRPLLAAAAVGKPIYHHDQQTMAPTAAAPSQAASATANTLAGAAARYMLRQKFMAAGQDFFIENTFGQRVMHVDGKALRVRDTLKFKDVNGNVLYQLQERVARVRDTMVIQDARGATAATIRHRMVTPIRERFIIEPKDGNSLEATGRFLYAEYKFEQQGRQVAEVSKRWFRARDMYGIEIGPSVDHNLILACAVCIDMMEHEGRV